MKSKDFSRQLRKVAKSAERDIAKNIDILTGGTWIGAYEDSVYERDNGDLFDFRIPAGDIVISFQSRKKGDSTFTADRVITYEGEPYPEAFIGSVNPEGRIVMNSLTDTDILIGDINAKAGTISLLFFDEPLAFNAESSDSSLGSQTAVGTYIFVNTAGF